jgi:hypothetical protein
MAFEDPFEGILRPILKDLKDHLPYLVLIGGWVPQLHRRFGSEEEWARDPISTFELDILLPDSPLPGGPRVLSDTLLNAGFRPVDRNSPPAVWERDTARGERIEFFLDHVGPAKELGGVRSQVPGSGVGGLSLNGLKFLREKTVDLWVPDGPSAGRGEGLTVRVPSLPAYLVQKGATFFRRSDGERSSNDLLYIVEIMAEGGALVERIEEGIRRICEEQPGRASLARTARNSVSVALAQTEGDLLPRVAFALEVRYGWSTEWARARARGFLQDFVELIPEDCGE